MSCVDFNMIYVYVFAVQNRVGLWSPEVMTVIWVWVVYFFLLLFPFQLLTVQFSCLQLRGPSSIPSQFSQHWIHGFVQQNASEIFLAQIKNQVFATICWSILRYCSFFRGFDQFEVICFWYPFCVFASAGCFHVVSSFCYLFAELNWIVETSERNWKEKDL